MAPRHDEIIQDLGDGFAVAWDSTETDAKTRRAVRKVAEERSSRLGEILGTGERRSAPSGAARTARARRSA
jgi:hypothetical protein